jgi:hypothetical protein
MRDWPISGWSAVAALGRQDALESILISPTQPFRVLVISVGLVLFCIL